MKKKLKLSIRKINLLDTPDRSAIRGGDSPGNNQTGGKRSCVKDSCQATCVKGSCKCNP